MSSSIRKFTMYKILPARPAISPRRFANFMTIGRAIEFRQFNSTIPLASGPVHTPDSYSKEVDTTPAADKTVNSIDPDSETVQRPYEAPSGPWSRAGAKTEEYDHAETGEVEKQPYTPQNGSKGRYGARGEWAEEKGFETSGPDEGPAAKSSGGRV